MAVLAVVGGGSGCGGGVLLCDTVKKSLTQLRDQELGKELIYKDIHCEKRLAIFPSPAELSLTKLSLTRPGRVLVSDIPAGNGKIANLFYSVSMTYLLVLAYMARLWCIVLYIILISIPSNCNCIYPLKSLPLLKSLKYIMSAL